MSEGTGLRFCTALNLFTSSFKVRATAYFNETHYNKVLTFERLLQSPRYFSLSCVSRVRCIKKVAIYPLRRVKSLGLQRESFSRKHMVMDEQFHSRKLASLSNRNTEKWTVWCNKISFFPYDFPSHCWTKLRAEGRARLRSSDPRCERRPVAIRGTNPHLINSKRRFLQIKITCFCDSVCLLGSNIDIITPPPQILGGPSSCKSHSNLIVTQLVTTFLFFSETRKFVAVFTRVHYCSLFWASWLLSTPVHAISLIFIFRLTYRLQHEKLSVWRLRFSSRHSYLFIHWLSFSPLSASAS
jgi:hypothetical protein